METPAFARVQERKEVATVPLRDLLAAQPKRLLLGMGTRFVEGFTFNLYSVYLLAYVVTDLELPRSLGAQRHHRRRAPRRGARARRRRDLGPLRPQARLPGGRLGGLLFAFPRRADPEREPAGLFLAFVGGLGVLYGVVYGPLAAFWSELFDTRYRYTALSTLYQVSGIVASGLTPLIAAWLVSRGGGSLWLVSTYAVLVAALSLVSRAPAARDRRPRPRRDLEAASEPARNVVVAHAG